MTNETIKVLLMVMLLGGIRAAIFVTEMPKLQAAMLYRGLLDWMMPPAQPVPSHWRHA
ncbi:hypothetical protein [Bradyrhizobium sp.]|uniref:hypothetical protein n=1 Tax=Bradyrhizobium sp. TaxID=376 RepID=UPI0023A2C4FE|nr:hypothetical protein [Bradyrhizobium sp.]MDE1937155.1 hypothetical protein [Bradyrhizobium sp.]